MAASVIATGDVLRGNAEDGGGQSVAQRLGGIEPGPVMIVPLQDHGRSRGVLGLMRHRGRRPFTEAEQQMAAGFASHAGVALEFADARAAQQRMIMLEDRERIARDLHDHVIQELFAVGLGMESIAGHLEGGPAADRVVGLAEDIDRTIRHIRSSIFVLSGKELAPEHGLRARVLGITNEVTSALGFVPTVAFTGPVDTIVEARAVEDVVACVREGLSNVARHAHATSCAVAVTAVEDRLTVTISDDGVGLPAGPSRRSGIANLQKRAENGGGRLTVQPRAEGGTVLQWTVRL
jgi:signal transduction histidine kinase